MGRMVSAGVFHNPDEEAYRTLVQPLLLSFKGDAFAAHEEIRSLTAIFPPHFRARLIEALAMDPHARGRSSAVGFLLDTEEAAALAAARGLGAAATMGVLDSECRGRIEMVRAWLPPGRRQALDSAVPPAAPPGLHPAGQLLKTVVSICDGSGAAALLAVVKRGTRHSIAAVLTKPAGIADAFVVEDLSRSDAASLERRYAASTPTSQVPLAAWVRLVGLAIGRNLAPGAPPPFGLVRALEALGLASLVPETATAGEIIEQALAGSADIESPAAIERAHRSVIGADLSDNWFEAGEAVDAVLRSTDSIQEGAQALIESYLPGRRAFWATQCALSALALKDSASIRGAFWKDLALVGRDLLGDVPIADIPLMRQIADASATAHFLQR
jgi:hypothetical protein